MVGTFLVFFALFATVIYPNAAMLHPTAWYATRLTDAHRRSIHPPTTRVSRSRLAPSVCRRRCQWLAALLPAGFAAPIAIIQNWTYAAHVIRTQFLSHTPTAHCERSFAHTLR